MKIAVGSLKTPFLLACQKADREAILVRELCAKPNRVADLAAFSYFTSTSRIFDPLAREKIGGIRGFATVTGNDVPHSVIRAGDIVVASKDQNTRLVFGRVRPAKRVRGVVLGCLGRVRVSGSSDSSENPAHRFLVRDMGRYAVWELNLAENSWGGVIRGA